MAKTYIQPGDMLDYTNGSGVDIVSGEPILIGTILAIATSDIADGASGVVAVAEVHAVRKATGAVTQGQLLYWDADGNPVGLASGIGCLTTTSTDNTLVGFAAAAAAESDANVNIKLNA